MKNKLSFFIILALLISLVIVLSSCGGKTPQNSDTGTNIDTGTNTDTEKVELEEYTVTFVQEGFANVVKTVKKGESLTDIPAPQSEEGYIVKWEEVDLTFITSDIEIGVVKTPIEYRITYVLNGGFNNKNNPLSYTVEDFNKPLYEPTKFSDSTFLGWYTTESFQPETRINSISECYYKNIVLYAYWLEYQIEEAEGFEIDKTSATPKLYKVIPNSIENIDLNQAITVSDRCTWKMFRDFQGDTELKLKAMTLDIGENKAYIIVYHPDGEHWSRYELVLYRLDILEYAFYNEEGIIKEGTIEEHSNIIAPTSNPSKTGYTFKGWMVNGSEVAFPYKATKEALTEGSIVFEPIYEINTYSIQYVLNGGENNALNPTEYTILTAGTFLAPTKEHYDFVGWYEREDLSGSPIVQISIGEYGNRVLYAKWKPTKYNINYVLNGGTNNTLNPDTYTIEEKVVLEAPPSRDGYTFAGWYTDSQFSNKIESISKGTTGELSFYASWTIIEYTITYELNGAAGNNNPTVYTVEDEVTLSAPTQIPQGYQFYGWYYENEPNVYITKLEKGTTGNKTLYAKYTPIEYTITYELNGGTNNANNTTTYTVADLPLNFKNPTHSREFLGWYTDADLTIKLENDSLLGDITLYAKWGSIVYTEYSTYAEVTGYDGTDTTVVIPSSFNGKPVTSIGYRAFYNCSNLTSVKIGNGVTSIEREAFYYCDNLTSVTIPDSVTSIGNYAFLGCNSLTSVNYLGTIANWCNISFSDSSANPLYYGAKLYLNGELVTEIVIPSTITEIKDYAFYNCDSLTSVTIGNSVTSIGNSAFRSCSNLTSITIPDSVTSIGSSAFEGCSSLTIVTIPDSVTSIGDYAFYICSKLTSITIGDGVTSIGDYAFSVCSLTSVNYLGTIENWCNISFSNSYANPLCNGAKLYLNGELVTELTIPSTVTEIKDYAFSGCNSLTSVTIPDSVTSIGGSAFYNCNSLTIYCEVESKPSSWDSSWNYSDCPVVWGHTHSYTDGKCICGMKEN